LTVVHVRIVLSTLSREYGPLTCIP
jgi:hypothetical protein